jgi:hypothetical protein
LTTCWSAISGVRFSRGSKIKTGGLLAGLTLFAFVLEGYHPGAEDDGIYLSAIKRDLRPGLYPCNSEFFTVQVKATVFDKLVAGSVRWTHLPVAYACLLWQLAAIFLLLAGCWYVVAYCFETVRGRLAGMLTVACVLGMPAAGTGLYLADEHLHPRTLATGAILLAIGAGQRERRWVASLLLVVAMLFHPIMGAFGIAFCVMYAVVGSLEPEKIGLKGGLSRAAVVPGGWLFIKPSAAWRLALAQHTYYTISTWAWYEWLGAVAPPFLLWALARVGRRRGNEAISRMALAVAVYSIVLLGIALVVLLPGWGLRLTPLQPMRYLQLTFLLMFLLGGAGLGEYVLRGRGWLWVLIFLPLAAGNGYAQRMRYPTTSNLELPWQAPSSDWLRAFGWVRRNTPEDAVFALDPHYLELPGEEYHSFRALAERSSLADDVKDTAVVSQVPALAEHWRVEHDEQAGWDGWTAADFARLAQRTPARWVMVAPEQAAGLDCSYANAVVSVCRLPAAGGR